VHPLLRQMNPNEEQLPAITVRDHDVVVTAGAGTGKTRTLVARFISLLAEGLPLRSIVAITFTRKAAREMRNRVRSVIGQYLANPDLLIEERRRWEELYHQLDAARIGTIHSLCGEILRAHPAEASIDPRFDVLDEGQTGILIQEAIQEAMAWAVEDPQALPLYALFGIQSLRQTLEDLMQKRQQANMAFDTRPDDLWSAWLERLLPPIKEFVDDPLVGDAFDELMATQIDGALDKALELGDPLAERVVELLKDWEKIQAAQARGEWSQVSVKLDSIFSNLKQVGSLQNWSGHNPKRAIKTVKSVYTDTLGKWLSGGINLELDRLLVEAMPALHMLFAQAEMAYNRLKDERQALDFDDLESHVLRMLSHRIDVRRRWQKEIQAILVDEYQDTNGFQRDLVNLINGDQGKLFIVGDAKQSIYRFRGADVSVFRTERKRITAEGGQAHPLLTSYRAHRELIWGLNSLLSPILGEREDPNRPWREPFAALVPYRETPKDGFKNPFIEVQLTVGSKGEGALYRAAQALISGLTELVEGSEERIDYGDVVILCRASTSFGDYEDALDEAAIPYLTVSGRGFFERPEIRDLLNALRALNDPSDDLAIVGLLRSPVFGFSDIELYQLVRRWTEVGRTEAFYSFLQQEQEPKTIQIVGLIKNLHARSGRVPVAQLLKSFLDQTNYRAALLTTGYQRAARNVSKLLADAHASGLVPVHEFLEYVEGLRAVAAREGEARATAGKVVRLMTVHAAKGLEFPIVVLGDINHKDPAGDDLFLDPDFGVVPKITDDDGRLPASFRLSKQRADDQEAAESERLLYVAATRVQEKLILNGNIRLSRNGHPGWLAGWLKGLNSALGLNELEIPYNENGDQVHRYELRAGDTQVACAIYEPMIPVITAQAPTAEPEDADHDWTPDLLKPIPPVRRHLDEDSQEQEMEPPLRVWRVIPGVSKPRAPAWIVGILVHEALARWLFPGPGFDDWCRGRANEHGLADPIRLRDAVKTSKRLLERFQRHPLYADMKNADRRLHELPFSRMDEDGNLKLGVIDVLYLRHGNWTIVEYKTDWLKDEAALEMVLREKDYRDQIEGYRDAVEQLTGTRPRSQLVFLNYKGGVHVEDSEFRIFPAGA